MVEKNDVLEEKERVTAKRFAYLGLTICCLLCIASNAHAGSEILNLTTPGDFGYIDGALFMQFSDAPTGTGLIDPFLTVQGAIQGHPQRGYNTDTALGNYDETYANSKTHSILLSDVPIANIGGTDYREFLLDINQSVQSNLSVDQIEIYLETSANISTHGGLGNLIYSLNAPIVVPVTGDETTYDYILLDDDAGSGKGDMIALIPDILFTGADSQFVYMYSMTGFAVNGTDGFEEWSIATNGPMIPEPATIVLLGIGSLALLRRRRKA